MKERRNAAGTDTWNIPRSMLSAMFWKRIRNNTPMSID